MDYFFEYKKTEIIPDKRLVEGGLKMGREISDGRNPGVWVCAALCKIIAKLNGSKQN